MISIYRYLPALLALLLPILLVGLHFFSQLEEAELYRVRIIQIVQQLTGRTVSLRSVDFTLLEGANLRLNDLEISAADPEEPPLLQVKQLYLGVGLGFFLDHRPVITSLLLVSPQINLTHKGELSLLQQVQETAVISNANLAETVGIGLAELDLSGLDIRDGLVTVIDWASSDRSTLIFDHVQLHLQGLSPTVAVPLTASARFQGMPFTLTGQLGPLPSSLALDKMAFILNLEAKSLELRQLLTAFSLPPINARVARGYFSAFFSGSLQNGVQSNAWLSLDKLSVDPSLNYRSVSPLDVAVRQKSLFHHHEGNLSLQIQEFYAYLEGTPWLDLKGGVQWKKEGMMVDLQLKQPRPLPLERLPLPIDFPLIGGESSGELHLQGMWPGQMFLDGILDLTPSRLFSAGGGVDKKEKIPLKMAAHLRMTPGEWSVDNLTITGQEAASDHLELWGKLTPTLELHHSGAWTLPRLGDYLPWFTSWEMDGRGEWEGVWRRTDKGRWLGEGKANLDQVGSHRVALTGVSTSFRLERGGVTFSPLTGEWAGGRVEASLLVEHDPHPVYRGNFTLAGVSLEHGTPEEEATSPLRLEGILSGYGGIRGEWGAGKPLFPPTSAWGALQIAPGRLHGMDPAPLLEGEGNQLMQGQHAFYWRELNGRGVWLNGILLVPELRITGDGFSVQGNGSVENSGNTTWNLTVRSDWRSSPEAAILQLSGDRTHLSLITAPVLPVAIPDPALSAPPH